MTKEEKLAKVRSSSDWEAAAWTIGYDDYPEKGLNPFEERARLWRFYNYGWQAAAGQVKKDEGLIWCGVCQDWIDRSELRQWSGDDSYHWLCPGCDRDLLPVQSEAEYFGLEASK